MKKIPMTGLSRRAFSLIELLTVVAVVALLIGLSVPAFNAISGGNNLSHAGNQVSDALAQARQTAITQNRHVALRLLESADGDKHLNRFYLVAPGDTPASDEILSKTERLPQQTMVSKASSISPLVAAAATATYDAPVGGAVKYYEIRFNSEGMLTSPTGGSQSYLTLLSNKDLNKVPSSAGVAFNANFFAIQVNPITGRLSIYRP